VSSKAGRKDCSALRPTIKHHHQYALMLSYREVVLENSSNKEIGEVEYFHLKSNLATTLQNLKPWPLKAIWVSFSCFNAEH
jgi:hypothetical protein